jgi:hypothetical protein
MNMQRGRVAIDIVPNKDVPGIVLRTQLQISFLHLLRAEELVHIPIHSLPNFLRKRRHIAAVGSGSTNMRSSQAEGRPHGVTHFGRFCLRPDTSLPASVANHCRQLV